MPPGDRGALAGANGLAPYPIVLYVPSLAGGEHFGSNRVLLAAEQY